VAPLSGEAATDLPHGWRAGTPWPINEGALLDAADGDADRAVAAALNPAVRYYRRGGVRGGTGPDARGVAGVEAAGVEAAWDALGAQQQSWKLAPPALHTLNLPAGNGFPQWREGFWLPADAYYCVLEGVATFGPTGNASKPHTTGDVFWVRAGAIHGPMLNVGNGTLRVSLMSSAEPLPRLAADAPSNAAPTVDSSLTAVRSYREVDGVWMQNPSPHTDVCMHNGGVQNMAFNAIGETPAVLRVRWGGNCSIPYHYHPEGALYFVQYGQMFFDGDSDASAGVGRAALQPGDVRWVQPGFAYGPEYNGPDPMQITVLGTEANPAFEDPPPGPYKMQIKRVEITVFG
jgi:hypothetical protein